MSQSYSGYSTGGYSLPRGFSVVIRFRHAAGRELGTPWLSYRSRCGVCGEASKGIDRRDYMQRWLEKHQNHNAEWKNLTADSFDFKVDQRIRDCYAVYVRLLRRGALEGGIRRAIRFPSLLITDEEKEMVTSLMELAEASRFFEDADFTDSAHAKSRPVETAERDAIVSTTFGDAAVPEKRVKRKARQPTWMRCLDQWDIGDANETYTEEEFASRVRRQRESGETPFPVAARRSVHSEASDLVEQAELVLAEKLLCGNVTKRKHKQSLICDVAECDLSRQQHRMHDERVGSGRAESVVWMHGGQMGDLADGSRLPQIDLQPMESADRRPTQTPFVRHSQLFSLGGRRSGSLTLLAKRRKKAGDDDRLCSPFDAERDVSPATRFSTLSRSTAARRDRAHGL